MQQVLEVKNLTKIFGKESNSFTAVDNLSLHINDGEILGLLGPNGAGKTTTIQMLLGVMEQTSGTIHYFGKKLEKHREEILKQINYSSTYISLPWFLTVIENLDIFARLYEIPHKYERIEKLLKEFEIEDLKYKQFSMLSAGERTRLLLVKSFLNYPKLILLDEPTASLDPDIAIKVREFLKKEQKEYSVSMLLTSHNMSEVEEMCDRVMVLQNGKVIAQDTPEKLTKNITECKMSLVFSEKVAMAVEFFTKRKYRYLQNKNRLTIYVDEQEIAPLLIKLAKENIHYQEISIDKPDLEDYFLQTIGGKTK